MMKPNIRSDYHAVFSQSKFSKSFHTALFKAFIIFSLGFVLGYAFQANTSKTTQAMNCPEVIDLTHSTHHSPTKPVSAKV